MLTEMRSNQTRILSTTPHPSLFKKRRRMKMSRASQRWTIQESISTTPCASIFSRSARRTPARLNARLRRRLGNPSPRLRGRRGRSSRRRQSGTRMAVVVARNPRLRGAARTTRNPRLHHHQCQQRQCEMLRRRLGEAMPWISISGKRNLRTKLEKTYPPQITTHQPTMKHQQ